MARYVTLKCCADMMGLKDAVKLLDMTLQQKCKTDEDLTKLTDTQVNEKARKAT